MYKIIIIRGMLRVWFWYSTSSKQFILFFYIVFKIIFHMFIHVLIVGRLLTKLFLKYFSATLLRGRSKYNCYKMYYYYYIIFNYIIKFKMYNLSAKWNPGQALDYIIKVFRNNNNTRAWAIICFHFQFNHFQYFNNFSAFLLMHTYLKTIFTEGQNIK